MQAHTCTTRPCNSQKVLAPNIAVQLPSSQTKLAPCDIGIRIIFLQGGGHYGAETPRLHQRRRIEAP